MRINSLIAKIPFFVLYVVLVVFTLFNWLRVILFQKDWQAFAAQQPWDYYFSNYFSKTFNLSQQYYFIFALPVVLLLLYFVPKIIGKIMSFDKNSNVKGDNHVAVILILFIAPVTLGLHKWFHLGWKSYIIPGFILISVFSVWSWLDEKRGK